MFVPNICGPGLVVEVRKIRWNRRIYDGMRYWHEEIPTRRNFPLSSVCSVQQRHSSVLDGEFSPGMNWSTVMGFDEPFSSRTSFLDFFCMMGMASCFSILLVALPAPFPQRADWWLDFLFSLSQRFRRTFTFDGTLVFNDCMEWATSAMGWLSPGLARSKDSFFLSGQLCHEWLSKRVGWLAECRCRDHQRLSVPRD